MRAGVDVRTISENRRGFRRLRNFIAALADTAGEERFTLFGATGEWCEPLLADARFTSEDPSRRLRMMYRRGVAWLMRPAFQDLDVMHFPTADVWYEKRCPTVVTLHDLAQLHLPEIFFRDAAERRRFDRHLSAIMRCSDVIATVSRYARDDLVERLALPPERVRVIYQGVEPYFARCAVRVDLGDRDDVLDQYKLRDQRFILYCGGLDGRKNVPTLIEAFAKLRQSGKADDVVLVIVGESNPQQPHRYPDLRALIDNRGIRDSVRMTGYASDQELAMLYAAATLFAFPSRMEGFGYAPLEAMSCGTPVICSNAAALPETVGDAACLVSPDDVDGWARELAALLEDTERRDRLRERGTANVQRFDWQSTAEGFLALYHEVAERKPLRRSNGP